MAQGPSTSSMTRLAASTAVWGGLLALCLLLSLAIAEVNLPVMAVILGGTAAVAMLLIDSEVVYLGWLFGGPTVFGFMNNYLSVVPGLTVDRAIFLLLVATAVAPVVLRKASTLPLLAVEKLVCVFLGYALVSLFVWSADKTLADLRQDGAMYLSGYMMPLGSLLLARRMRWTEERIHLALVLLVLAAVGLGIIAALQTLAGVTIFNPEYLNIERGGIAQGRATGTFASASEFGAVMATLLVLVLPLVRRTRDGVAKVALGLCALCILGGLVLAKTRGPFVCFVVSLLVLFVMDRSLRPVILAGAVAASLAGLAALPFLFDLETARERLTEITPIYNRLSLWATGINMALHHPLLGLGFTRYAFLRAMPDHLSGVGDVSAEWATVASVPHNEYIHVAVLLGLPGLAVYLGILSRCVSSLRAAARSAVPRTARHDVALCAIAVLCGYMVNGLVIDYGLYIYFGTVVFGLAGIALSPPPEAQPTGRHA